MNGKQDIIALFNSRLVELSSSLSEFEKERLVHYNTNNKLKFTKIDKLIKIIEVINV